MFGDVLSVFGRGQEARSKYNSVESNALRYKNALSAFGVSKKEVGSGKFDGLSSLISSILISFSISRTKLQVASTTLD
jgi:hypothetical protein